MHHFLAVNPHNLRSAPVSHSHEPAILHAKIRAIESSEQRPTRHWQSYVQLRALATPQVGRGVVGGLL
jgi:hypothetical protein